jgi:hypothetical protein
VASITLLQVGCGDDDNPNAPAASPGRVTVELRHVVNGEAVVFDDIRYTNAAGDEYSVVRLEYLLSNLALHAADGSIHGVRGPFYNDARTAASLQHVLEQVPSASYDAISFTFGLDETTNVSDAFLEEPWNSRMAWPFPLGGGYHYMILDGFVRDPAGDRTHNTHLGRTQQEPHFFHVVLPIDTIAVDGNESSVRVTMEISEWYTGPNDYTFPQNPFIMDMPTLQQSLMQNGGSVFSASSMR